MMGAIMIEQGPAFSRLCLATLGGPQPLRSIQQSDGFFRLHLDSPHGADTELAVTAPGLDEVSLVSDLITALREQVAACPALPRPVLAGFHVGIVRLTDSGFAGVGADRVLALLRDPAIAARAAGPTGSRPLFAGPGVAVAITARLFEDLRAEGLDGDAWQPVPQADAWLRLFRRKELRGTGES
jgi:hypothetical protein